MDEPPEVRWSATFAVAGASTSSSLRGDKIKLPQSALEQLLAAAPRTSVPTTGTFTAFDPSNPYSVAAARQERALYQETTQQLPNPLTFRLVNPDNGNVVYAGIREFSAQEGEVSLSPYLLDALGISNSELPTGISADIPMDLEAGAGQSQPRVTVHAKQLGKGTYVRLRPLEAGYNPVDWKSLLERELRNSYTTITKDAMLSVRGVKGEDFKFLVDRLEPVGDAICIVDTDLEVDIEALNEEQARETMRQIMSRSQPGDGTSSSKGGELDIWKDVQGLVMPGDYVDYELPAWDRTRPISIELSGIEDEDGIDIFVTPQSRLQRALPRDSEHVFGNFARAERGFKAITIQPTNVALDGVEKLMVSIHGYGAAPSSSNDSKPRSYTLRARTVILEDVADVSNKLELGGQSPDNTQCTNCLQWVPKRTLILHQNFCLRNNIICPKCKSVFKKSSEEWQSHWHCEHDDAHGDSAARAKHDDIYHTERYCGSCEFAAPSLVELALHRTTVCPGKLILCQFCHLEVPQEGDPFNPSAETLITGLTAHELADGARTTECHLCNKIVRLRDMAAHLKHHELDRATRPKPEICRNINCGRTLHGVGPRGAVGSGTAMGQGPGNEIGLCSICFGPLYVSMHDPEGKALQRRIERRYLAQLMTGCGKKWCSNEWCRTGRANLGLEAKGSSAQATLPLVKNLMTNMADIRDPVYFCVDEGSQRRKKLAEMMAEERIWDLEWCVAACEAESGDLTRAREWLSNWAPARVR